jgi:hypothetical protein
VKSGQAPQIIISFKRTHWGEFQPKILLEKLTTAQLLKKVTPSIVRVHYCVQYIPTVVHIVSQINPILNLPS